MIFDERWFSLGLSKGNARFEISASVFFSFSHSLQVLNTHERRFDSDEDEHIAWCNGGRGKVYAVEDQLSYVMLIERSIR